MLIAIFSISFNFISLYKTILFCFGDLKMGNIKNKIMQNINNTNLQMLKTFDLTSFSQENISFLSDQITNKNLYQIGYYHFFKIPQLDLSILRYFLQLLDYNKAYIVYLYYPLIEVKVKDQS
jgi:trans-2-enoyl-CoA reductase